MNHLTICLTISMILFSWTIQTHAHMWTPLNIPENQTDILETWVKLDKNLKETTQSLVKMLMPTLLESTSRLNLSSQCVKESLQLVYGVRSLKKWAVSFVDASAKGLDGLLSGSFSFLGEYDQCLEISVPHSKIKEKEMFRGQYCLVEARTPLPPKRRKYLLFDQVDELRNFSGTEVTKFLSTLAHIQYFQPYRIGLCIPSGCTMDDLSQLLSIASEKLLLIFEVRQCEVKKEEINLSPIQIFAIVVSCLLGTMVLLGTWLEIRNTDKKPHSEYKVGYRILLSFSMITNFKRLVSTKTSSDSFQCIHGMRFLTITWVVLGHSYFFSGWFIKSYRAWFNVQSVTTESVAQMIINGSEAVDTFIFMSGLLVAYFTLKLVKVQKRRLNITYFVIHRLWRIAPAYYFIILFVTLAPLMGSGPLFHETMSEYFTPCYQYWWRNLLFINNYFHMKDICMIHTWYVSCDIQLYLASLLVLLPMIRSEKLGLTINALIILISIFYNGVILYFKGGAPSVIVMYPDAEGKNDGYIYNYGNTLSRAGPYFIGVFTGYLLLTYPEAKLTRRIRFFGWCLAILSSGLVIFITGAWYNVRAPTKVEVLMYASFYKVAFTAGVAWMTYCCIKGYGGIINNILSWKVWVPLSKLTFLTYLTQPIFQTLFIANFRSTQEYNHLFFIVQFFGFLCISSLLAMVCNLLVESPFISMEKIFLADPKKRDESETNNKFSKGKIVTITLDNKLDETSFDNGTENRGFDLKL